MRLERIRQELRGRGMRWTPERECVVGTILGWKGHFDPEELHISLRQQGHRVSLASIYRTLPILMEMGILDQVQRTDKHAHYEVVGEGDHHDHMLCMGCGSVIEFYSEELERLQESLCGKLGFMGLTHTLEIRGHCAACSREDARNPLQVTRDS